MKRSMTFKFNSETIATVVLFIFLIVYPFVSSEYRALNMASFIAQMIFASSVLLIWGYCGIFSFGQTIFYGFAGYTYAILLKNLGSAAYTPLAMVAGIVVAVIVALVLGYFMFYGGINDMFVGLVTMCVTMTLNTFMAQTANEKWRIGSAALGGYNGINQVPMLTIGAHKLSGFEFYAFVLILFAAIFFALKKISTTRAGYTMIAVRDNRHRTQLLGYNTQLIQVIVFAAGAAIAAFAGILYSAWGNYVGIKMFDLQTATIPVMLVAAGGKRNPAAVFAFSLLYLNLSQRMSVAGNQYALILQGLLMIVVMLFLPDGIFGTLFRFLDKHIFDKLKINNRNRERSAE